MSDERGSVKPTYQPLVRRRQRHQVTQAPPPPVHVSGRGGPLTTSSPIDAPRTIEAMPRGSVADLNRAALQHTPDYRSIRFHGQEYTLTKNQAKIIALLHAALQAGMPAVDKNTLLSAIEQETSRVRDSFKKSPLWNKLVVPGARRGTYRLDLEPRV